MHSRPVITIPPFHIGFSLENPQVDYIFWISCVADELQVSISCLPNALTVNSHFCQRKSRLLFL